LALLYGAFSGQRPKLPAWPSKCSELSGIAATAALVGRSARGDVMAEVGENDNCLISGANLVRNGLFAHVLGDRPCCAPRAEFTSRHDAMSWNFRRCKFFREETRNYSEK
jgi:hypothetical protein